jgi:regulatory protein
MPTITAIRRSGNRPGRVDLYLDGELRQSIAAEVVLRAGLGVGRAVDEASLAVLVEEDRRWAAREAALRMLARRPHGEGELRERLAAKGHPPAAIESCVGHLRGAGLLDDAAFARAYAAERIRTRPSGRYLLLAELRGRGIEEDVATEAVDDSLADAGTTEVELARRAAARFGRRRGEPALKARRRLHAFLSRRGFSVEVIRGILEGLDTDQPPR